jgi:hypothetical protein
VPVFIRVAGSVLIAILISAAALALKRVPVRTLIAVSVVTLAAMVAGAAFGWPLYPWSNAVTLTFGVCGGTLLGRTFPVSQRAFFILLAVLSVLDVAQNFATSGPPSLAPAPSAPNPHFVWLNFRIPLPSGHLNLGVLDLGLIAAMTDHLGRNHAPWPITLLPGVLGLVIAEIVFNLHAPTRAIDTALVESLVPYLTIGWLASVVLSSRSGVLRPGSGAI